MRIKNCTDFNKVERFLLFFIAGKAEKRWKRRWKDEEEEKPAPMFRCQFDSCELCPMDMECWENVEKMMEIIKLNCILRGCVYGDQGLKDVDEELPDGWG